MKTLLKKWSDYWFEPGPAQDLAIFRIVVVAVQLYYLLSSIGPGLRFAAGFPDNLFEPILMLRILTLDLVATYRPAHEWVMAVYWLAVVSATLSIIGWRTNFWLLVLTLSSLFVHAYNYSFGEMHHPDAIFMIVLAILAISPSGAAFSVDSLRMKARDGVGTSDLNADHRFVRWPLKLVMWLFSLFYLSGDISKMKIGGIDSGGLALPTMDWANGYTLQYYLARDALRWPERTGSDVALWLSEHHELVFLSQWTIVIFQATFWLNIFFPRLLWIYIPIGLLFHVANWFLLSAPFPQWIACYVAFVPWTALADRMKSRLHIKEHAAWLNTPQTKETEAWLVYDGDCPFCSRYVQLLRIRERIGKFHLVNARDEHPVAQSVMKRFDLDEGMVLKIGDRYFHGDECIYVMSLLSESNGVFGAVNATIFRSPLLSKLLYPVLRSCRNLVLRMLGRPKINVRLAD